MNRTYPLRVTPEQEESVRNAAQTINNRIKSYRDRFSVKDDLDLVIMCCLEIATDNLNQVERNKLHNNRTLQQVAEIDAFLNSAILHVEESGLGTES